MNYKQYTSHEISDLNKTKTWYSTPIKWYETPNKEKEEKTEKKMNKLNIFFMLLETPTWMVANILPYRIIVERPMKLLEKNIIYFKINKFK